MITVSNSDEHSKEDQNQLHDFLMKLEQNKKKFDAKFFTTVPCQNNDSFLYPLDIEYFFVLKISLF